MINFGAKIAIVLQNGFAQSFHFFGIYCKRGDFWGGKDFKDLKDFRGFKGFKGF